MSNMEAFGIISILIGIFAAVTAALAGLFTAIAMEKPWARSRAKRIFFSAWGIIALGLYAWIFMVCSNQRWF